MSGRASYTFDLDAQDLDWLRLHLLHAQAYSLDRVRDLRNHQRSDAHARAIAEAEASATSARTLWALLAGVRSLRAQGECPIGYVERDELLRFLGGYARPMDRPSRT